MTIKNEKGRLQQFGAEDESQRKRIEGLNSLSSYVCGLKNQVTDQERFGGKLPDEVKIPFLPPSMTPLIRFDRDCGGS